MGDKAPARTICRKPGGWAEKRNDATRAAGIYKTQEEAIEAARETLNKQGGGELIVIGRNGRIRSKDTIAPTHDPQPPSYRGIKGARSREGESIHPADAVTVRPTTDGWKTVKTLFDWRAFEIQIEPDEDGWLVGTVTELPGCHTQARTEGELVKRLREAVELALTDCGERLPKALFRPPLPK
jgi:predicted RNase H-like HicB family nuclease